VQWLFGQGVAGVAPFGTTGEGQSFSVGRAPRGARRAARVGARRSACCPAPVARRFPETIALTKHATERGCVASLVLPPFFWKSQRRGTLHLVRAADRGRRRSRLRIFLYHLPQVSSVPLSVDLVARLAAAFPGTIAGIKDSQGKWETPPRSSSGRRS
jgi:4-hydroxy-tetrahydrodipicolinate synthase